MKHSPLPKTPKISVMIVNFNGAAFIRPCLDSLLASDCKYPFDVWVVDNQSSDDSMDILKSYGSKITLIENPINQGFSYANNQIAKACDGDHVFLLNNDTVIPPKTLEGLMDFCLAHPDCGAVTPKLCNEDGSLQAPGSIWGQWRFLTKTPKKVPFIAGAAVLMPKSIYWEMNGLDENLFFYNDDIDMCKMLKKLGYGIYYNPEVDIIHYGGLSTKYRRVGSLIEGYRGGIYLSNKHYGPLMAICYRTLLMIDILLNILIHSVGALFSQHSRDFLKGYCEILRINLTNDVTLDRS